MQLNDLNFISKIEAANVGSVTSIVSNLNYYRPGPHRPMSYTAA
ncbi:hypothetical protein [Undibacterium danionis]|uniref:Uncharacterized protein n=1 Tax=Undibacterium danionis TaxID=1812100 RepID=A0ABV6IHT8_9BURK